MDNVPLSIMERFEILEDPRTGPARRHELRDIIVITLCAVICGADNWVEIEEFGKAKEEWFRRFLKLPNGNRPTTPSGGCSGCWTQSSSQPASWTGYVWTGYVR